jgi:hypothetical protein
MNDNSLNVLKANIEIIYHRVHTLYSTKSTYNTQFIFQVCTT